MQQGRLRDLQDRRATPWEGSSGSTERPEPIPFSFSIPARFTVGQSSGNISCLTPTTARIRLSPPISFSRHMEAHLVQGSVPFSQPNLGAAGDGIPGFLEGNNRMSITWPGVDGGNGVGVRFDVRVPKGLYGTLDLQDALNYFGYALALNSVPPGAVPYGLGATPNYTVPLFQLHGVGATQQVIFGMDPTKLTQGPTGPPYGVFPVGSSIDFINPGADGLNDSMGPILGFTTIAGLAPAGGRLDWPRAGEPNNVLNEYLAPNPANFAIYSAYVMYMSMCRDSYNQGATGQLLYVFNLGGKTPQSVVQFQPPLPSIVPVSAGSFSTIDVYFTDDQGRVLTLDNFDGSIDISLMVAKMKKDGSV